MDTDTLRRLLVFKFTSLLIAVNKKFGLDLGEVEIAALASLASMYLLGSNLKAAAEKRAEAAAKVTTTKDAVEVFNEK